MSRKLISVILLVSMPLVPGYAAPRDSGPGMIVSFNSSIEGRSIDFIDATSSTGASFSQPGTVGGRRKSNPLVGGAIMGAAPDGRELPDWVEFTWRDPPYPEDEKQTLEEYRALPHHTARVQVRSRVPQDVIDVVIESNRKVDPGKLPDKMLWVYFIWYEDGIRFRWKLKSDCCGLLREGGDDLPE